MEDKKDKLDNLMELLISEASEAEQSAVAMIISKDGDYNIATSVMSTARLGIMLGTIIKSVANKNKMDDSEIAELFATMSRIVNSKGIFHPLYLQADLEDEENEEEDNFFISPSIKKKDFLH